MGILIKPGNSIISGFNIFNVKTGWPHQLANLPSINRPSGKLKECRDES